MSMEEIFTQIYRQNGWFHPETVSGSGSAIFNTVSIREELPILIRELGVRTLCDIPCGDCNWIRELSLDIDLYVGADVVREIIDLHQRRSGGERRRFYHWDITHDPLPAFDLVLCRDCLVHFSLEDARKAVGNIVRSRSRFLVTTTYPSLRTNEEIATGDWRPVNLEREPFCFPPPLRLIREHQIWQAEVYTDKSLGVWRIEELPPLPAPR
jgi:hypothetical protein